jgi:YVTN family beta-propeller protein
MSRCLLAGLVLVVAMPFGTAADERDRLKVGLQPDGRIVVPTNQILKPAGTQVTFPGRPVDLLLIEDGKTLVAKNMRDLVFIDPATGKVKQTLALPAATEGLSAAFSAVGLLAAGDRVFATDSQSGVRVARRKADGSYGWEGAFVLPAPAVGGAAYPTGIAMQDEGHLWVCSSRGNDLQLLSVTGVQARVPVGVAPYMPLVVGDRVYVSNWGGDRPGRDDPVAKSSGTPAKIDPRTSVANHGSVSVVMKTVEGWRQVTSIPVGGHPSGMTASPGGAFVYVANANSDTVSVIDTARNQVVETIDCKPEAKLPFGTGSNAVAVSPDGRTLYVANGTGNCVAAVELGSAAGGPPAEGKPRPSRVAGLIPTGWYPGAVRLSADGKRLFVANVKGHGALQPRKVDPKPKKKGGKGDGDDPAAPMARGKNSHDHLGSVSLIDVPDGAAIKAYTETVNANNRLGYSLAGMEKPRPDAKPVPLPARHGEPCAFEHVIYVIKENRTYDQVFGDMKEGNGDPNLCIFGEEVTPNQHKLAREFVLLDNFYCSGVLSADGHSWVNAAYATDYLEKQFGQFTRSYPYEGSDPLAFPVSGFLWDNALARKKTFRNYGEFVRSAYEPKGAKWADLYADYTNGTSKVKVTATPNMRSLEAYSHPNFPGFPLTTPDVYRAKMFIDELKEFEKKGEFPNLVYLFLPADHTNGTRPDSPTPRAMVADNDLALGMVVEAVSRSKFWPKTCILVTEDDPQNGFDHVDGHRTVGLVVSPYSRRKAVDSTCYNQTGMVKTIELMLGLPPMTQLDLSATPMHGCFTDTPDLTPYAHVKNRVPLDEMNKPVSALTGKAREFALKSLDLDFDVEDRADEDTLNRILWFSVRGDRPYPGDR